MDNRTEETTPEYSNVVDSVTSTIPTKKNPSYELRKIEDIQQSKKKEINNNDSKRALNIFVVMIIIMVILFIINILSIALSVAIYTRLSSGEFKILNKIDKTSDDIATMLEEVIRPQCSVCQNNTVSLLNISKISIKLIDTINNFISVQSQYTGLQIQTFCGPGLWYRVVYLNMSNPTEQCPSVWREYNINGVRACGRPITTTGSCSSISSFTGYQYSRVCGRVIGYQYAAPDAFQRFANNDIDLDGINITYGARRNHIWSYVAGLTQNNSSQSTAKCPCSTDNGQGDQPPSSISHNYYCESGNPDIVSMINHLYIDDPLWDGQQCEGTCCTGTNSPPWFSVQLPTPTTEMIEVSICCDQNTQDEDVPVKLIEIFIQ